VQRLAAWISSRAVHVSRTRHVAGVMTEVIRASALVLREEEKAHITHQLPTHLRRVLQIDGISRPVHVSFIQLRILWFMLVYFDIWLSL